MKWPVGLGILVWLCYGNKQNREALEQVIEAPKIWGELILAFVLILTSTLLTFARWFLLVRGQGFAFRFRDALRYGFAGLVANWVMPGSVGGDLFKAVLLARDQTSRRSVAVATVLLDRILGLLALFMVGVGATLVPHDFPDNPAVKTNTQALWIGTTAGLAGLVFLLLPVTTRWGWVQRLSRLPLVGHIVGELIHGVQLYQSKPGAVIGALALSLAGHAGMIAGFYHCAKVTEQPWIPDLTGHFYFMPSAELVGVLGATPGGVGVLELAIQQAYVWLRPESIGKAEAEAAGLTATLVLRVVQFAVAAIGGIYFFASRREISGAMEEASHLSDTPPAAPATSRL